MPCGFTRSGLPVAMQLVGDKFDDAKVLQAARAYEMAQPFVLPKPDSKRQTNKQAGARVPV